MLNEILIELESEQIMHRLKDEMNFPVHFLRKVLDGFDAKMLGFLLEGFHNFRFDRYNFDLEWFKLLYEFNEINSNPRFVVDRCPEESRDVLAPDMLSPEELTKRQTAYSEELNGNCRTA